MRFCKDCAYFVAGDFSTDYARERFSKCALPKNLHPVTGGSRIYCEWEREDSFWEFDKCGHAGRHWKPK